jgi:membrane protease YdiL (CAAX protease family)
MPLLLAIAVLAWARATHKPWSALGLARPQSWARAILGGIVLGVVLKLVMMAIVMPLLGAEPTNPLYRSLMEAVRGMFQNPTARPAMVLLFALYAGASAMFLLVSGFCEEVVFRGFLFERFGRWWGHGPMATVLTIVGSAALFGLTHVAGYGRNTLIQATLVSLVYGAIYARTRSLWLPTFAHFAFDALAVLILFAGLEERVAHLLF